MRLLIGMSWIGHVGGIGVRVQGELGGILKVLYFLDIAQSASVSTETAVKFAFCYRPFRQSRAISAQVENDLPSTTTRTIAS